MKLLEQLFDDKFNAFASPEIIQEYFETYNELHRRYRTKGNGFIISQILNKMHILSPDCSVKICRDPDDNKFINCAISAKCLYIVSGDKDLLSIKRYKGIKIVTVAEFISRP
ncbi:MAG: putative toxin-antitoxin system toxin component, PIN family [Spirochaetia bacterium]|nr:putative toxin-antitoxin system toxin component, PIN family [Spirochaetia bacterium]